MGLGVGTLSRECWYRVRTLSRVLLGIGTLSRGLLGIGTLSRVLFGIGTLSRELLILVGVINHWAAYCQYGRHFEGLGPWQGRYWMMNRVKLLIVVGITNQLTEDCQKEGLREGLGP